MYAPHFEDSSSRKHQYYDITAHKRLLCALLASLHRSSYLYSHDIAPFSLRITVIWSATWPKYISNFVVLFFVAWLTVPTLYGMSVNEVIFTLLCTCMEVSISLSRLFAYEPAHQNYTVVCCNSVLPWLFVHWLLHLHCSPRKGGAHPNKYTDFVYCWLTQRLVDRCK